MPGDLLYKKYDFFCVILTFRIYFFKFFCVFALSKQIFCFFYSLFCELVIRLNVAEYRRRVAVSAKLLNLKRGVDKRIASCKRVVLRACEDIVFINIYRYCF